MLSAELQELRENLRAIKAGIREVERDIAWDRVIDSAIRMCRLLCKAELAELDAKYRADQPRVPAGNPDGGQWTDDGNGSIASTVETDDAAQSGGGDSPPFTFINTATGERVDTTTSGERRFIDRYTADGTLAGRTIHNEDGSSIETEYRVPRDPSDWTEQHVLTTAEGNKYWVTNIGDTQKITTGEKGEILISSTQWTANGPVRRIEQAFLPTPQPPPVTIPRPVPLPDVDVPPTPGPSEPAPSLTPSEQEYQDRITRDLVNMYEAFSARNNQTHTAVIAREYAPGDPKQATVSFVGIKTRDDIAEACPKLPLVQSTANRAAADVYARGLTLTPQQYGTAVHVRMKDLVKAMNDNDLRAEVSAIKSATAGADGAAGSIRIDTFERVRTSASVCIGDLKTGKAGLTVPRMTELAAHAQAIYPGTRRIYVFEVRPGF